MALESILRNRTRLSTIGGGIMAMMMVAWGEMAHFRPQTVGIPPRCYQFATLDKNLRCKSFDCNGSMDATSCSVGKRSHQ